jgi:hypothetical protein
MSRISWRQIALFWLAAALAAAGIALLPGSRAAKNGRRIPVHRKQEAPLAGNDRVPPATPLPVASDAMGYPLLMLLNDPRVQHELGLTTRRALELDAMAEAYLQTVARLPAEDARSPREALLREHGNRALDHLTASERQRLNEIMFQLRSIDIYREAPFVTAL